MVLGGLQVKLVGIRQEQVDAEALTAKGQSVLDARISWYHTVGDGIWFKEQRGEVPPGTWEQAVTDMKASNPYPDGYTSPTKAVLASLSAFHLSRVKA
jgi:hypothetical protein